MSSEAQAIPKPARGGGTAADQQPLTDTGPTIFEQPDSQQWAQHTRVIESSKLFPDAANALVDMIPPAHLDRLHLRAGLRWYEVAGLRVVASASCARRWVPSWAFSSGGDRI